MFGTLVSVIRPLSRSAHSLLVLHAEPPVRERIRRACPAQVQACFVSDWDALRSIIENQVVRAVVVVDPYHGTAPGRALSPELRALLADFPSLPVLALVDTGPARYRDICELGAWGVADVISLEQESTPAAIAERLRSASGWMLRLLVERVMPESISARGRMVLLTASEVASEGGGAEELACALFVTGRTLHRWCADAGLPAPRRLMLWMRVLLATELLDDPGRTISGVALACGYASDNALRTALAGTLGQSVTELRRNGAFTAAAAAFGDELRAQKDTLGRNR